MCHIVRGFTAANNFSVEGLLKLKILRMLSICVTNSWHLCVILCILKITDRRVSVNTLGKHYSCCYCLCGFQCKTVNFPVM